LKVKAKTVKPKDRTEGDAGQRVGGRRNQRKAVFLKGGPRAIVVVEARD